MASEWALVSADVCVSADAARASGHFSLELQSFDVGSHGGSRTVQNT